VIGIDVTLDGGADIEVADFVERMATGMSLGPIAIRATTAITAISDQAKSNIVGA
jgi:hypothetical protein